ncbi:MAG TPA: tRNA adenosine(34) deaminase TadA [Woeseiaceae bacterium]|nr:tRNA adenosine(34) deaminase TadA [Woeseiaceae bacterium]
MRAALAEAERSGELGEIPVGAVVVRGSAIVGTGHNRSIVDCDPSAHAEIVALRAAAKAGRNYRLNGASLFVTLEPCAMCIAAAAQARVTRVVFGAYDKKAGAAGSVIDLTESNALNHRMEVNGGVLAEECGALLRRFFETKRGDP